MQDLNSQKSGRENESKGYAKFSTRNSRLPIRSRFPNISKPNLRRYSSLALLPLISFILGLGGGWLGARSYENDISRSLSTEARQKYISNESELIAGIAQSVGQSVVSITVERQAMGGQNIFGFSRSEERVSAGTGFIINKEGVIMTNRHVVSDNSDEVVVTLADGTRYDNVQLLGRTSRGSSLDIAFLKLEDLKGKRLTPVAIGDSSKMKVGDRVIAIGNALGQFQNSVTSGIISGYGRDVTAADETGGASRLNDLFQTDAAINQGNSGGPLVNINGEVIGVNTAVAGGAQNIGFAIPINDTKGLISSILETGKVQQPYLGVRYMSLTDDRAVELGLNIKRGAYIVPPTEQEPSIIAGSPAEKAGLQTGDVILKVNSIVIDEKTSLAAALSRFKVGERVSLEIWRDNQTSKVGVTLEAVPQD